MKETAGRYIRENMKEICLYLGFSGSFFVVFELCGIQKDVVNYAFLLAGFWAFLYGILKFVRYAGRHEKLLEAEKRTVSGVYDLPEPAGLIEEDYQRIISTLYEMRMELESSGRIARQEMTDYYGMWVHQVKTPIAALRVLIQAHDDTEDEEMRLLIRGIKVELFKIEQYVEMVLTYLRMESMSSDLAIGVCSLDSIIRQAVRKYSQMFILQKIRLEYQPTNKMILTDEKWVLFVLEQILSNALKYTVSGKNGCVTIYMNEEELVIADNGIGIYPEDLPRVFERGFTGYNGRSDKKSTGIGLYLCKSVMNKLKHGIRIESRAGEGTKVMMDFSRSSLHVE